MSYKIYTDGFDKLKVYINRKTMFDPYLRIVQYKRASDVLVGRADVHLFISA